MQFFMKMLLIEMLLTEDVTIGTGVAMIVTVMTTNRFFIEDQQLFYTVKNGLDGRLPLTMTKNY